MKILIVGLGNPILSDDAIGLHIVREIKRIIQHSTTLGRNNQIKIIEESVNSLELVEKFIGYDKVIVIDSIKTNKLSVGDLVKLSLGDLTKTHTRNVSNPHDIDFYSSINVLKKVLGKEITNDITIYGIEVKNIQEFGETLSPELSSRTTEYAKLIIEDIEESLSKK